MQHLSHGTSRHVGTLLGQTAVSQIPARMLRVRHVHIADDVHNASVCLFWQTLVFATVSCFHMEDRDMKPLGTNYAQAGVGIAQNQYGIRLHLHHQMVTLGDDVAHGLTQVVAHGLHIDVGVSQFEVLEEDPIEVVVVVLAGVRQQAVEVLSAFIDYCSQANNLGSCTYYDEKL